MSLRYLIATILFSLIFRASAFSYKDAKNWGQHYPKCNGILQSPIAMDANCTDFLPLIKEELKFTDFHTLPKKMTVKNTGLTVEVKSDWSGKPPMFTGGPLRGNYVFEKIIFRWAQGKWTEYINYKPDQKDMFSYDMEMQWYFYKEDFKSFKKAQSKEDGLAIYKFWLDDPSAGEETKPFFGDLEKIIHKVQSINSTALIPPFPLEKILYVDSSTPPQFQFYKGSLDYPPCSESVTWFEPQILNIISKKLLNGFRKIKLNGGDVSNVRPPQPLNKRPIKMVYAQEGVEQ